MSPLFHDDRGSTFCSLSLHVCKCRYPLLFALSYSLSRSLLSANVEWHIVQNIGKKVGKVVDEEESRDKVMKSFDTLLHSKTEEESKDNLMCPRASAGLDDGPLKAFTDYFNTRWTRTDSFMPGLTATTTSTTPVLLSIRD